MSWNRRKKLWMGGQVAIDRIEDTVLVVGLRFVARDPWKSKLCQDRGYVLVFELDRPMRASGPSHEVRTISCFDVWLFREFMSEHREIDFDDCIKFVVSPSRSVFLVAGHLWMVHCIGICRSSDTPKICLRISGSRRSCTWISRRSIVLSTSTPKQCSRLLRVLQNSACAKRAISKRNPASAR
jgi:hypothetical protein